MGCLGFLNGMHIGQRNDDAAQQIKRSDPIITIGGFDFFLLRLNNFLKKLVFVPRHESRSY